MTKICDLCSSEYVGRGLTCSLECRKLRVINNKSAYDKQYRLKNKEKIDTRVKHWRIDNPEKLSKGLAKYYQENKEKCNKDSQLWAEQNREASKKIKKKWADNNQEYIINYGNDTKNKLRTSMRGAVRVSKYNISSDIQEKDLLILVDLYHKGCHMCFTHEDLSLDHNIPVSKGGNNDLDNLQILCMDCNRIKSDRTLEEWVTHELSK